MDVIAVKIPMGLTRLIVMVLALVWSLAGLGAAEDIYHRIYQELHDQPHRQPGSEAYEQALQVLEAALSDAGLESERQTFDTLVPVATECVFEVDGKLVGEVHAWVPPRIGDLPNTHGETISGKLVYCGDGASKDFDGKPVADNIVVLELGSRGLAEAMRVGARAIVLVGNQQTRLAEVMRGQPAYGTPVVFVERPVAKRLGLLDNRRQDGSLRLDCAWEDRVATNLWVHVPGEGTVFDQSKPEMVVLSATLDTIGLVPSLAPQQRQLANVAMLAQLLHDLKRQGTKRDVLAVFLGAHMAAEEGMRHLYYGFDQIPDDPVVFDDMQDEPARLIRDYLADAEESGRHIDFLGQTDFIKDSGYSGYFDVIRLLRRSVEDKRNEINYEISLAYRERKRIQNDILEVERAIKARGDRMLPDERQDLEARLVVLQAEMDRIDRHIAGEDGETGQKLVKRRWNDMNRQIIVRKISDEEYFERLVQYAHQALQDSIAESRRLAEHVQSTRALMRQVRHAVPICHYHLDFTSAERPWLFNLSGPLLSHGLVDGGGGQFNIGAFRRHLITWRRLYDQVYQNQWAAAALHRAACELSVRPDSYCAPMLRSNPATAAQAAGVNAYSLCSVGGYELDELPVRSHTDLRSLLPQMTTVLGVACNHADLSLGYRSRRARFGDRAVYRHDAGGERNGLLFQYYVKGGSDIAGPARGALAVMDSGNSGHRMSLPGYLTGTLTRVNSFGFIFDPNISGRLQQRNTRAIAYDEHGHIEYRSPSHISGQSTKVQLHYGHGGYFEPSFVPGEYDMMINPQFLVGATNARFSPKLDTGSINVNNGHLHMSQADATWKHVSDGLILLGTQIKTDLIKGTSEPVFRGLSNAAADLVRLDTTAQATRDLSMLNEQRLEVLREKNIINDAAETLHATAGDYRDQAAAAAASGLWSQQDSKKLIALTHEYRAYEPVRQVADDMVKAVVILLLLSIPFAFAIERLVIGAVSIYRQIAGFGVVFVGTFVLLYLLHPAFSLAATPIAIFLAFVIIMMSASVIYVVMGKFKVEVMALQGLASKSHDVESNSSTAMASVFIGISGMRNRPLKTFLTAATVVLLTFTILVFASFSSSVGVVESYLGQGDGADRIEFRRSTMLRIPDHLLEAVEREMDGRYESYRRSALFFDPTFSSNDFLELALTQEETGASVPLRAVLGFDPAEADANPRLRKLLADWRPDLPAGARPIYLATFLADRLGLQEGDAVSLRGITFTYAGSFSVTQLQGQSYMGGARMVPPDFRAILRQNKQTAGANTSDSLQKIDVGSFQWSSPAECAIVRYQDLQLLDVDLGLTNALMLYPNGDQDLEADGRLLSTLLLDPVYVKSGHGATGMFFTEAFKGSGFDEVLVPLLLGGLIIFSSLLGSIVDREREIFTFSALGLAPPNVAALFFAESSVYAVVGGVGGYLFSQVVAWVLKMFAAYGWFQAPEMNFSSLSSTYTILLVMATVILSTIYPAIQAGKSANPGVARKWKMPKPDGRRLHFLFPFTVSAGDMVGILSFIHEHFANHGDASLGSFAASEIRIRHLPDHPKLGHGNYALEAEVSLAPFDLGIFQRFRLSSRDSDIEGIKEVLVDLELENGSPAAWQRSSRHFIADLRKQFLLWRSLPAETVAHYCSQTVHEADDASHVSRAYLIDETTQKMDSEK
jgi:hypothetical protein